MWCNQRGRRPHHVSRRGRRQEADVHGAVHPRREPGDHRISDLASGVLKSVLEGLMRLWRRAAVVDVVEPELLQIIDRHGRVLSSMPTILYNQTRRSLQIEAGAVRRAPCQGDARAAVKGTGPSKTPRPGP